MALLPLPIDIKMEKLNCPHTECQEVQHVYDQLAELATSNKRHTIAVACAEILVAIYLEDTAEQNSGVISETGTLDEMGTLLIAVWDRMRAGIEEKPDDTRTVKSPTHPVHYADSAAERKGKYPPGVQTVPLNSTDDGSFEA